VSDIYRDPSHSQTGGEVKLILFVRKESVKIGRLECASFSKRFADSAEMIDENIGVD
jgi:hypothetical protein